MVQIKLWAALLVTLTAAVAVMAAVPVPAVPAVTQRTQNIHVHAIIDDARHHYYIAVPHNTVAHIHMSNDLVPGDHHIHIVQQGSPSNSRIHFYFPSHRVRDAGINVYTNPGANIRYHGNQHWHWHE